MHFFRCMFAGFILIHSVGAWALPDDVDFVSSSEFPTTAAFGWAGTALPDGRYIVWDGDTIYVQRALNMDSWRAIASGYTGDPAFIVAIPNSTEFLLGAGFSGDIYRFDRANPADYTPAVASNIGSHYAAVFLTDTLFAIDRSGAGAFTEIAVFDLTTARSKPPVTVLSRPASSSKEEQVVEKPGGSYSASIALNSNTGLFYVTDAGNGLVKSFMLADLLNAYNTATPLDWVADGTSIGSAFQYPTGGVSGFTASGNLVMGGFGSIVEVDPSGPTTIKTLDPAGTGPFYNVIYNDVTEDLIVIESAYPNPSIIHMTQLPSAAMPVSGVWMTLLLGSIGVVSVFRLARKRVSVN